jgi:YVTN family beta-propeller protein
VSIPGYQLGYLCIGANQDGSKAFIGISNNQSAIVRFATSDAHTFSETYTPFWIGTSPDHAWAISGQYRFTVIDYASESILGQYEGIPQYSGAISPVGLRAVALNPFGFEGLHFYDFAGGAPSYLGGTISGLDPEGDCPHRVTITPDGSRAIVTNVLSDNAVVVDLSISAVVATIPVGSRPEDVAITPDSRWAVVGSGGGSVKILDLLTNAVVADVATGSGAATVSISPDGTKAFVGNSASNTVSIIALSGPDSHRVADVPVGEIGILWASYGVYSDVRTSPDNRYCLVATSFDDKVKVIDSRTNTVVANVTVGDFPLQIAFDADGSHAIVTNYQGNSYSVLRVNGQLSYVIGTYAHGMGPMRLDSDPAHNQTAIGNFGSKTVSLVNPETGALIATQSYTSYGNVDQVIVDETGEPIVLTTSGSGAPGYLVRGTQVVSLPAAPACFDYSPVSHTAVVAEPGPDWFTVVNYATAGAPEVVDISGGRAGLLLAPTPNPVGGEGDASLPFVLGREGTVRLSVTDAAGRAIASIPVGRLSAGRHVERWTPPAGGVYFVSLAVDGRVVDTKKVVVVGR